MGHLFRINSKDSGTKTTIVDWSNANSTPYDKGYVDKIDDTTTTQREITSIPSPFARIELVKEAFGKIVRDSVSGLSPKNILELLHGNSIYHKMVSDTLDIAQIFFSYPSMEDKVEIIVWDKAKQIADLLSSSNDAHRIVGKTLDMFFSQDSMGNDPYNFGKMKNIYILRYKGPGHRQMHIIGATSPATLFFSTANDESAISKHLCFGTDYAFDTEYASLDMRDPEFIKYLFTFRYSEPNFDSYYPELAKYMDAVFAILPDELKNEIGDIQDSISREVSSQKSYIDSRYTKIQFSVNEQSNYDVEVNGHPIHYKEVVVTGNSDFEILTNKVLQGKAPLVLPVTNGNTYEDMEYFGSKFGRNIQVPYFVPESLDVRKLPGINVQHPYLTISDFLDDKIIKLPAEVNADEYFNGNFASNSGIKDGYLLPILPLFFDYFTVDDLMGLAPSGKHIIDIKTVASGVEVTLRIPVQNGHEIEYKRIYTLDVKADKENNAGAIVIAPEDFVVGTFPSVKFADENDAHYRVAILSDFLLNKQSSCVFHNEKDKFFSTSYVVRNVDITDDIRSKVYILEKQSFDCAQITVVTDQSGKEKKATGLLIPKFKQRSGSASLMFAIDLGTSNTHIEYTTGLDQLPQPFSYDTDQPQMSLICKPSDIIRNHLRGEFVPEKIGHDAQCHFPMRTVLCIDKNNAGIDEKGTGAYAAFGNASPAFMYNKTDVGVKYNDYVPNLKWSSLNYQNEERIRCYIESLFLLIRTKVIQEGGSLSQTQIKWFYPISMSNNKRGLFERVWTAAYQKYFNNAGTPIAITESIAPYSYFQQTRQDVTNIVTIDIGGGTTDIVVADTNTVKLVTSMRFAADAIFGNSLLSVQDGPLNGIIRQFKDEFITNLNGLGDLQKMLRTKTEGNYGNSSEVASFLFSLAENELVKQSHIQDKVDFNDVLMKDGHQKIVFYIFFTAIMYHLAHMMKAKNLEVPTNIAFSGNGSKVVSVLSPNKDSLELLTSKIFGMIYQVDVKNINLIINSKNPKEATCKGGLLMRQKPTSVADVKTVLLGTSNSTLVSDQKYSDVPNLYSDIVREVKSFMDFITLRLPKAISLSNEFGIDNSSIKLAVASFNKDLKTYIEKGVELKLNSMDVSKDDIIEEPLFFYPIIGVINDLSDQICAQVQNN